MSGAASPGKFIPASLPGSSPARLMNWCRRIHSDYTYRTVISPTWPRPLPGPSDRDSLKRVNFGTVIVCKYFKQIIPFHYLLLAYLLLDYCSTVQPGVRQLRITEHYLHNIRTQSYIHNICTTYYKIIIDIVKDKSEMEAS